MPSSEMFGGVLWAGYNDAQNKSKKACSEKLFKARRPRKREVARVAGEKRPMQFPSAASKLQKTSERAWPEKRFNVRAGRPKKRKAGLVLL